MIINIVVLSDKAKDSEVSRCRRKEAGRKEGSGGPVGGRGMVVWRGRNALYIALTKHPVLNIKWNLHRFAL